MGKLTDVAGVGVQRPEFGNVTGLCISVKCCQSAARRSLFSFGLEAKD